MIQKKKKILFAFALFFVLVSLSVGCGKMRNQTSKRDHHLTVYLWDNNLMQTIVPYIKEQIPDQEIEFISGNNNVNLYHDLQAHGDLPDILTTRRFSANDAKLLRPYLMDFSSYDVVSSYYPYALQYYTDTDGNIQWLPVCGIPETMIVNKSLLERYGIEIPRNYQAFADACKQLKKAGIKPYVSELSMDWAAHSLIQGAAIDQFSSLQGLHWRNKAESAQEEISFDPVQWQQIFAEVNTFLKDTYLDETDLNFDLSQAKERFLQGQAAMFRATPAVMEELQAKMEDELIRLPYFAQTSDESWIYTYPSFNVAFNEKLELDEEKLDVAMRVLDCFLSEEGQRLIADGNGMISYNADVDSDVNGMYGVEEQVQKNAFYIRYSSNHSFTASLLAVRGLLSGMMDETKAFEVFQRELNNKGKKEESVAQFQDFYSLCLNDRDGRDAASSILTTIRKKNGADFALSSYYYYPSSIYQGDYTEAQLGMMTARNDGTSLWLADLSGAELYDLMEFYLQNGVNRFQVTNCYELPIVSGMRLCVKQEADRFHLTAIDGIETELKREERYRVLLTDEMRTLLLQQNPDVQIKELPDTSLSAEWIAMIESGQQPEKPEDYMKVEQKSE